MRASAVFDLGLTEDQFWDSTPRELAALYKRFAERERRQFIPFAALLVQTANLYRDKERHPEPYSVAEFLGEKEPAKPLTIAEKRGMRQIAMVLAGAKPKDLPEWARTGKNIKGKGKTKKAK